MDTARFVFAQKPPSPSLASTLYFRAVCGRVLSECASLFQTAANLDILCSHTDIQDILDILKIQEILFVLDILDILDITIPDGWASLFQTAANLARMADPQHSFAPLLHHIT